MRMWSETVKTGNDEIQRSFPFDKLRVRMPTQNFITGRKVWD